MRVNPSSLLGAAVGRIRRKSRRRVVTGHLLREVGEWSGCVRGSGRRPVGLRPNALAVLLVDRAAGGAVVVEVLVRVAAAVARAQGVARAGGGATNRRV